MASFSRFLIQEKKEGRSFFRQLPGWKFDGGYWPESSIDTANFRLVSKEKLSDDIASSVPILYYKSGIGSDSDLEFDEINFEQQDFLLGWSPGVLPGSYYIYNDNYYLHSSESTTLTLRDGIDYDGLRYTREGAVDEDSIRSLISLEHAPKKASPIDIRYLSRDMDTLSIGTLEQVFQVGNFTGLTMNGYMLDGSEYAQTDKTKKEFLLRSKDGDKKTVPILLNDNLSIALNVGTIVLEQIPVKEFSPVFSRKDIFRRELTFSDWNDKFNDPLKDLETGDYAIGYQGLAGEGSGVRVYLDVLRYDDYGTIEVKPDYDLEILFNQYMPVSHETLHGAGPYVLGTSDGTELDTMFFLPSFPVLDLSSFSDGDAIGTLNLDTTSTSVFVDGVEWTRVQSLESVLIGDPQNVFELNPVWGEIRFGNGGLPAEAPLWGNVPTGEVTATWTAVPLIRYDTESAKPLFSDNTEDLDPLTNSLRQGFLVLDHRRLIPWKIILTTTTPSKIRDDGTTVYGKRVDEEFEALDAPPRVDEDTVALRARVVARGNPARGVPNIPVEFICKNDLMVFSVEAGTTDGDGYVDTEAFGRSTFRNYVWNIDFYEPVEIGEENYLNPAPNDLVVDVNSIALIGSGDPSVGVWDDAAPDWTNNVLTISSRVELDAERIYLLIKSIQGASQVDDYSDTPADPNDVLVPYNAITQKGGLTKVWSFEDTGDTQSIVHPVLVEIISGVETKLYFNRPLPRPIVDGVRNLIMGYQVVIDRTEIIEARTTEAPLLVSNELEFSVGLNDSFRGQWRLPSYIPDSGEADGFQQNEPEVANEDGSRISTAVYMNPNSMLVTEFRNSANAVIVNGAAGIELRIIGEHFPITEELKPSVFIIRLVDGRISAVRNITEFCEVTSSTLITIAELPTPPGPNGLYHIAVGGFHPGTDDTERETSKSFTFTA